MANMKGSIQMKAKLFLILIPFLMFTLVAAKCDQAGNQTVVYAIETAAVAVGYFAAQAPDVDMALRNIYDLAVQGRLTPEGVNKILARLNTADPFEMLLTRRILRLAELVGASVADGQIVDVAGIPPEFVSAISRGYVEGYDTFVLTQVKRS